MTCPNCSDEDLIVSFFWGTQDDIAMNPYHQVRQFFKFNHAYPWGNEYISICCGTHWLQLGHRMYLISPKQKEYFEIAQQHTHHLSDEWLNILNAIHYTSVFHKMGPHHYPCAITLNSGEVIERATLILGGLNMSFFHNFPFEAYRDNLPYYFLDEIKDLRPSDYACSIEVRQCSQNAPEIRYGLAPYTLKNERGDVYTCSGYMQFVQIPQIGDTLFYPISYEIDAKSTPNVVFQFPRALAQALIFVHDPRYQTNIGSAGLSYSVNSPIIYEHTDFAIKGKFK